MKIGLRITAIGLSPALAEPVICTALLSARWLAASSVITRSRSIAPSQSPVGMLTWFHAEVATHSPIC